MTILHHIQTSTVNDNALAVCINYASESDSILLSGDAVYAIFNTDLINKLSSFSLYLLESDISARGLINKANSYQLIDYVQFVSLVEQHSKVISW